MHPTDEAQLRQEIVRRILAVSNAERIILFGSRARATPQLDSDFDMLVVEAGIDRPRQRSTEIRRALRGLRVPVDVVVATPEQLAKYGEAPALIYATALREGEVLYERSTTP